MRGGDVAAQLAGDAAQGAEAEHRADTVLAHGRASRPHPARLAGVRTRPLADLAGRPAAGAPGPHVQYPDLPECDIPCPDRWGAALHRELRALSSRRRRARRHLPTRSAASCGCARPPRSGRPSASTASSSSPRPAPAPPSPSSPRFYPTGADKAAIDAAARHTRLVCSDDDAVLPRPRRGRALGRPAGAARSTSSPAPATSTSRPATGRGRRWRRGRWARPTRSAPPRPSTPRPTAARRTAR